MIFAHMSNFRVFTVPELTSATESFSERRLVGRGGFARVYRATLAGSGSGEDVAVKRWDDGSSATELMNELTTLATIAHPNLLQVLGFAHLPPTDLMLVMPLMARGSLHDALHGAGAAGSYGSELDTPWRVALLAGLARGVRALHVKKIVHRDVKSANVLIGDDGRAVLGDAGTARTMRADAEAGGGGTCRERAPGSLTQPSS